MSGNNHKTDHILNGREVGMDYFKLFYLRSSNKPLKDYLTFNEDDYWIYKLTSKQRLIGPEWKDFKYSGYIFFKKTLYNRDHIDIWIDFFNKLGEIKFLDKPTPPFHPDKIIIKQ